MKKILLFLIIITVENQVNSQGRNIGNLQTAERCESACKNLGYSRARWVPVFGANNTSYMTCWCYP